MPSSTPPAAPEATFALALEALGQSQHAPESTVHPTAPTAPAFAEAVAGVWEELGLLGKGGMGTVHAARDPSLDRVVAIKRPISSGDGDALVAEARTLARMDHPNVVPVHALTRGPDGLPLVVMKRVEGRRWTDLLREGRDLERDLDIALEVADALRFAHAQGVVHRDVKPDNVMVGRFGEVYLMDWGCAASGENLVTTAVLGTPAYLAPEMLTPGAPIGAATDVFLLGATLHRAVTGQGRHRGGSIREVLAAARAPAAFAYGPDVPVDLARILNQACAADPRERFGSVEAFADALRTYRRHRDAAALADEALARSEELLARLADGGAGVDTLWDELRGDLRAALRAWPGNARVRAAQSTLAERVAEWKLGRGDVAAAEALLDAMLPAVRARWADRLVEARTQREARDAELHAQDLNVAARDRMLAGVVIFCGAVIIAPWVNGVVARDGWTPLLVLHTGTGALVLVLAAVGVLWRGIARNRASTAVMMSLVALTTGGVVHRALAWWTDSPPHETLRTESVWMWSALGVVGLLSERGFVVSGLPYLAAAVAIAVWPARAGDIFPVCTLVSVVISVIVLRRRVLRVERGEGAGR